MWCSSRSRRNRERETARVVHKYKPARLLAGNGSDGCFFKSRDLPDWALVSHAYTCLAGPRSTIRRHERRIRWLVPSSATIGRISAQDCFCDDGHADEDSDLLHLANCIIEHPHLAKTDFKLRATGRRPAMATTNAPVSPGPSGDRSSADRLTNGLGWFSVGLGLAEVLAPEAIAAICGVSRNSKQRTLLRLYGARELAAGLGILSQPRPAGWVWGRVAGDAVDLSSLAVALRDDRNDRARVLFALASVIGVTAADIYCAQSLRANGDQSNGASRDTRVVRTIMLDKPIEDAYAFWRNFQNLPRIMDYLESVRYTGDRRTHWIAKGPVGAQVEWDAETIIDTPNAMIGWRSVEGSAFDNSGVCAVRAGTRGARHAGPRHDGFLGQPWRRHRGQAAENGSRPEDHARPPQLQAGARSGRGHPIRRERPARHASGAPA